MNRALVSLISGALLVLLVGLGQEPNAAIVAVLGVVFSGIAVAFQLYLIAQRLLPDTVRIG